MRILLIEDEGHKAQQITSFLNETYGEIIIEMATSVQEGITKLNSEPMDVILLDMSLPVFTYSVTESGFQHNSYGGEDVLEYLDANEKFIPTVVISAFDKFGSTANALTLDDLDKRYNKDFSEFYKGAVLYSPIEDSWRKKLKELIGKIH